MAWFEREGGSLREKERIEKRKEREKKLTGGEERRLDDAEDGVEDLDDGSRLHDLEREVDGLFFVEGKGKRGARERRRERG